MGARGGLAMSRATSATFLGDLLVVLMVHRLPLQDAWRKFFFDKILGFSTEQECPLYARFMRVLV